MPSAPPTTSRPPTASPTARPTRRPTAAPTHAVAPVPRDPGPGYFNYDPDGPYGPRRWKRVRAGPGDPGHFWHDGFAISGGDRKDNDCGSDRKQSPIDVCDRPREVCTETHEMRPKSGDYRMDSDYVTKQILSNKLRLVLAPRTGEEPDPPQIDFSSNGRGIIDMTHIDFKFPSEHTVCGYRFDGEMQYFTYHTARKRFVAVSFFLDGECDRDTRRDRARASALTTWLTAALAPHPTASETNPKNGHLQEVIDAFKAVYDEDARKCRERQRGGRQLHGESRAAPRNATTTAPPRDSARRRLALKWHPFHPDVQKTVHFWGYSGSFTDPPCTRDSVDWKVMDVPTPMSPGQLADLKRYLFDHVDGRTCRRTSVHNAEGSVARPIQGPLKYYKCTRDDYVSDEERVVCGDGGCADSPFGAGLNRYYPPLVDVTGPPTRSPS